MKGPKISVIVPCYNMASYIEQTLTSIIYQNYNNLELIIIDGGSQDGTLNILNKYKENFAHYISEPDNGQYDAITKGFSFSTGDLLCWINADDIYFPWTLKVVAETFKKNPQFEWIKGIPAFIDENGLLTNIYNNLSGTPRKFIRNGWFRKDLFGYLPQENIFWRRSLWEKANGLTQDYMLAGDFELWTRFAENSELLSVGLPLAAFRKRSSSRSVMQKQKYEDEVIDICRNKKKFFSPLKAFGKSSIVTTFLLRLLTWRKAPVYYFNVNMNKWVFQYRIRPVSSISFAQLLLEKKRIY